MLPPRADRNVGLCKPGTLSECTGTYEILYRAVGLSTLGRFSNFF